MSANRLPEPEGSSQRYEALLNLADVLVHHGTLPELSVGLASGLHQIIHFQLLGFCLHDAAGDLMRPTVGECSVEVSLPTELPLQDAPGGWVWQHQEPMVLVDLRQDERFPRVFGVLEKAGLRSFAAVPMTTSTTRLGAFAISCTEVGAYDSQDVRLLLRVGDLMALSLEASKARRDLEQEKRRLQTLLEISSLLAPLYDFESLLPRIAESLRRVIPHEFAGIGLSTRKPDEIEIYPLRWSGREPLRSGQTVPIDLTLSFPVIEKSIEKSYGRNDLIERGSYLLDELVHQGIQSVISLPLRVGQKTFGTLNLGSTRVEGFSEADVSLLRLVAPQIAVALDHSRAYRDIAELKNKLAQDKLYLEGEIRTELGFEEVVGSSPPLKRALAQAKVVAPSDATALILGETGTGKELIARAIHRMSARRDASFIKLNCAAIPTGLLESELFGHEKGAFTGAISQKIGRLELAHRGTLFLDEVGDIPLELQPKLLRVLQDQEFERLGSARTIKVDARLIAATNRDLEKLIAEKQFRSDLYYRLKVFPIAVPALREREKDIPLLVRYFVQKYARRMDKHIETIPTEVMDALMKWHWPGNVRELENFIERSVILTEGTILRVPVAELRYGEQQAALEGTLRNAEREHIVRALRESGGVIAGGRGAAARLGMKRTTLQSRMTKLGITRTDYEN